MPNAPFGTPMQFLRVSGSDRIQSLMSLTPGTSFGPFEILSPIGVGGMGEVYRTREAKT
jgi:hypothetical protein